MKALSLWQPWGSLIMIGAKPWEFRKWPAPRSVVGQRIVCHASKRPMKLSDIRDLLERLNDPEWAWTTMLDAEKAKPFLEKCLHHLLHGEQPLALGAGLGTMLIGPSREGASIAREFGGEAAAKHVNDSDRIEHSKWGWKVSDPEEWPLPIPMGGSLGLWNWPEAGKGIENEFTS